MRTTFTDTTPPITPDLLIKDAFFGVDQIEHSTLNIELSDETLRFGIVHDNAYVWVEDYSLSVVLNAETRLQTLQSIYHQHAFLASNFWKGVHISFNTPHFTLIPSAFFRKEYAEEYLKLVAGKLANNERTFYSEVKDSQMVNIFGVEGPLTDWFLEIYPQQNPVFTHQTSTLIEGARTIAIKNQAQPTVVLYFENGLINVVVMQQTQLLLCNKFSFKNPYDMTYCVLFILEQLHIKPADIQVVFYGEITPYSESFIEMTKFLPNTMFGKRPTQLTYTPALDDLPDHRYFSLYALGCIH